MKRILAAGLMAAVALTISAPAFAWSVSLDVPVAFKAASPYLEKFKGAKLLDQPTGDVSGYILGVSSGWLGVGYEKYDVGMKFKGGGGTDKATFGYQIYDVFVNVPIPYLHPVIGYGKGVLNVNTSNSTPHATVDPADVSQAFLRFNLLSGPLFDLHVGYHKITAEDAAIHGGGGPAGDKVKGSGETYTVGIRAGW